jgi:hypothetical protein
MMRHLMTLVLSGVLGSILLVGDVQACHNKRRCTCATPVACAAPARVACFQPFLKIQRTVCVQPAPCVQPTACAPQPKKGCGLLARLCQRKQVVTVACVTPVYYAAPVPSAQSIPSPAATPQR